MTNCQTQARKEKTVKDTKHTEEGGAVATEALPASEMTREQMIEHLTLAGLGDIEKESDDSLRAMVVELLADGPGPEEPELTNQSMVDQVREISQALNAELSAGEPAAEEPSVESLLDEYDDDKLKSMKVSEETISLIQRLRAAVAKSGSKSGRRVASGSKARPNVKYTILAKPPEWSNTPQIAQLQHIIFDPKVAEKFTVDLNGKKVVQIPEPELFDLIRAGAEAGVLKTTQEPVRIFQYYRSDLVKAGALIYG